jgi:acylphosphatase
MDHQRVHARVRGRVQGVGFRFFTEDRAAELGVTGWVRNLPDGSVELMAEGPRTDLERLIAAVRRGPPASRVHDVETEWSDARGDLGAFRVRS